MGELGREVLEGAAGTVHAGTSIYGHHMIQILAVQNIVQDHIHGRGMSPPRWFQKSDGGRHGQIFPKPFHTPGNLRPVQRFDKIVRGADREAVHGIIALSSREDNRQAWLCLPDLPCGLNAGQPAQHNVQEKSVTGFRAVVRYEVLAAGVEREVHALLVAGTILTDQHC